MNKNNNMIRCALILVIMLLLSVAEVFSQTKNINYIKENIYTSKAGSTSSNETYFDGLGRELQTVKRYPFVKDIVILKDYDRYGRETGSYLPYITQISIGYVDNAKAAQSAYYRDSLNSNYGYSQFVYDNTTNNNIIEQSLPGESWKIGSGHTQKTKVSANTAEDKIKCYRIEDDTTVVCLGIYDPGRILKKETIDPQGDKAYEFYDNNILIAKEMRSASQSTYTYYVYDNLGLLRCIIPPMADQTFNVGDRKNPSQLKIYCFYTEYDKRHRPYKQYIPGAGCIINLYDNKDRLVFSQNETLRSQGKWMFTKYDRLDRPVIFGICGGTELDHTICFNGQTIFAETRGSMLHGYTNNAYPTDVTPNDCLTITYYDNYDWQGEVEGALAVSAYPDSAFPGSNNEKVAGYIAGTKQKILGISENKWLLSANYYDDKYREIQSVRQLYPGGIERIHRSYDYVGKLTRVKEVQTVGAKQEGFDRELLYDRWGNLSEIKQGMVGYVSTEKVSIVKYTYNGLWQIVEKTNHNGIDTTRYAYSLDGKQIGSTSPLFSYKLYFDTKPSTLNASFTPRYDGNVSMIEWHSDQSSKGYLYAYDAFKQLQDASYLSIANGLFEAQTGYGEKEITYDLNGNIKKLRRTDSSGADLHNIVNIYGGNQLFVSMLNGAPTNYIYDRNGNMIYNHNKGIDISYNALNLPEKIVAGTEEVSYIYSASGQKLATKAGSSTTYYRGSFIYNNDELDHILQPEGIIRKTTGAYVYYYAKKDHLGSTRVLCHEANGVMKADQTTDYYPFGLSHHSNATNVNRYLFSGKELQDQLVKGKSLDLYDFGARNYDPMLGRWFNIDPALQFANPYIYCNNNPMMYIDPNGKWIDAVWERDLQRYKLLKGAVDKDDLNIYLSDKNGNRAEDINGNFVVIGQQLTAHSFFDENDELVKGAQLDNRSREGLDFLSTIHNEDPDLGKYILNGRFRHSYDFKSVGGEKLPEADLIRHYYRGYIIGKRNGMDIYASARDIGNYVAGYVSARNGLPKFLMRAGFDFYQGAHSGRMVPEGLESTQAQNLGYANGAREMTVTGYITSALITTFITQSFLIP